MTRFLASSWPRRTGPTSGGSARCSTGHGVSLDEGSRGSPGMASQRWALGSRGSATALRGAGHAYPSRYVGTPAPSPWPGGARRQPLAVGAVEVRCWRGGRPEALRQVGGHVAEKGTAVIGADVQRARACARVSRWTTAAAASSRWMRFVHRFGSVMSPAEHPCLQPAGRTAVQPESRKRRSPCGNPGGEQLLGLEQHLSRSVRRVGRGVLVDRRPVGLRPYTEVEETRTARPAPDRPRPGHRVRGASRRRTSPGRPPRLRGRAVSATTRCCRSSSGSRGTSAVRSADNPSSDGGTSSARRRIASTVCPSAARRRPTSAPSWPHPTSSTSGVMARG